jgi:hypothetical protein
MPEQRGFWQPFITCSALCDPVSASARLLEAAK